MGKFSFGQLKTGWALAAASACVGHIAMIHMNSNPYNAMQGIMSDMCWISIGPEVGLAGCMHQLLHQPHGLVIACHRGAALMQQIEQRAAS